MVSREGRLPRFSDPEAQWGAAAEMNPLEATMWRAEADPRLRSSGVILELLDLAPDWRRLVAGHAWAIRRAPRLRQRVVEDPSRLGPPAWCEVEIDLDYHLRRMRLAEGSALRDALAVAESLHMAPLDPARPLWEAILVEGLADGQAAFLLKLHHCLADGTAFMQLFDLLRSVRREPTKAKPAPALTPPRALSEREVAVHNLTRVVRGAPASLKGLLGVGLHQAVKGVRDPVGRLSSGSAWARSLARAAGTPPGTPSPLLAARGLSRRLGTIEVPLQRLRRAGRQGGGSLNDAFLAGLAGGMGRYHAEHGHSDPPDLPFALPVSLRGSDDEGGNRFTAARIAAPVAEPDPAARIATIRARVLAARGEPALDFLGFTAPLMCRLPGSLLARATLGATSTIDLQASNFPGLERPAYVAGARVLRMFPFGPVPGGAMMAVLVSHGDTCCIGLTFDHDAIPDTERMERCLREGMAEVLALAPELEDERDLAGEEPA